ncbi:hypothetical protein K438DRAFT_1997893 [Mycena galopus ATCC 62051]|nr:hypothetical protein K438DRAFT_1997893 [Mycena galopus ATCC 62051]
MPSTIAKGSLHTAAAIEEWNARLGSSDTPFIQLGLTFPASFVNPANITISRLQGSLGAKAMFPNKTEAVFTLVGVVTQREVPPVKRTEMSHSRVHYARQHATIAGVSSALFLQAIQNLEDISFEMHCVFAEAEMQPWHPDADPEELGGLVSSNCRYYTTGKHVSETTKTTFDERTDPHGILSGYLSDTVSHCFDNDIAYLALVDETYVDKDPAVFRAGDIVEMAFAFMAWKLPKSDVGPKYTSRLVLRALTYRDGTFTKEAHLGRSKARSIASPRLDTGKAPDVGNQITKRRLKDAVACDTTSIPEIRVKMSKMMIQEAVAAPSDHAAT